MLTNTGFNNSSEFLVFQGHAIFFDQTAKLVEQEIIAINAIVEAVQWRHNYSQGDNYLYYGLQLMKKNPSLPYANVYTSPIMYNLGVNMINREAVNPHAAALFADWTLERESQQYLSDEGRGPVALKHPYLPDNANLVATVDPPKDVADKLLSFWRAYVEKRGK